jgi:hypothetical protein
MRRKTIKLALLLCLCFFSIHSFSQMTIGSNSAPVTGSVLDLESTNQGLLFPRVSLSATGTWGLLGSGITGMVVYNTNASITGIGASGAGLYYWNNSSTSWNYVQNGSLNSWSLTGNGSTAPGTYAVPGTNFIGTTDALDFALRTSGAERMRISAAGNIGINQNYSATQQLAVSTATAANTAIAGQNTAASSAGAGIGVLGSTLQSSGYGVMGTNANAAGYALYANNSTGVTGAGLKVNGTSNLMGVASLGTASAVNGSLIYNNNTNANTVTINSGATSASYSLTLPTGAPSVGQVLSASTATQLGWTTASTGTVTSIGLTMPSAFTVSNSPVTSSGTIAVTGAGTTLQYIRGDGSLASFPAVINSLSTTVPIYNTGTSSAPVIAIQGNSAGTDKGGILYSTGTGTNATFNAPGTAGQVLLSGGSGSPIWGGASSLATASNGLTATGATSVNITLGGSLTNNTTITQPSSYSLIHNLTGTGDFQVQISGTDIMHVYTANSNVGINTAAAASDRFSVGGTTLNGLNASTTSAAAGSYGVSGSNSNASGYGVVGANSNVSGYALYANNSTGVTGAGLKVNGTSNLTGVTTLGTTSAANGSLVYNNSFNANTVAINSGATSASYSLTLPTAVAAANNQVLSSTTSGVLSWSNATAINSVQNGVVLNTTTSPATGTSPYIELGGSLVNPTTISDDNTNTLTISSSANNTTALAVTANSLTSGSGFALSSSATLQSGGSLLNINSTGPNVGGSNVAIVTANGTTVGNILNLSGTGLTSGSVLNAAAGTTTGNAVGITANGLTQGTGLSLTSTGSIVSGGSLATFTGNSLTTGNGINLSVTGMTTGNGINETANSLTTGNAISVASSSAGITTGSLLNLSSTGIISNSNGSVLNINSTAANTAGYLATVTGNTVTTGNILNISGSALTTGAVLNATAGTTTGTAVNITANGITTGYGINLSANSLTNGTGLKISSSSTNINSGSLINLTATGNSTGNTVVGINSSLTGANGTSIAGQFSSTNATNSYAIIVPVGGGNVGFGTSTPNRPLVVQGGSTNNIVTLENTNNAGYTSMDMYDNSGNLASTFGYGNPGASAPYTSRGYFNSYGHDFVWMNNVVGSATPVMMVSGQAATPGYIGIQTLNPAQVLEVAPTTGTVRIDGLKSGSSFNSSSTANTSALVYVNNSTGDIYSLPTVNNATLITNSSGVPSWSTAVTSSGSFWSLTGNTGTTAGTNFIGTTDAQSLYLKVNGTQAGLLQYNSTAANSNTTFGLSASSANGSTAIGAASNAAGTNSLAVGNSASASTNYSTVIGASAASSATNAVAVGYSATANNNNSVAVGNQANAAYQAVSIGSNSTTTNNQSVAIGYTSSAAYQAVAIGSNSTASNNQSAFLATVQIPHIKVQQSVQAQLPLPINLLR